MVKQHISSKKMYSHSVKSHKSHKSLRIITNTKHNKYCVDCHCKVDIINIKSRQIINKSGVLLKYLSGKCVNGHKWRHIFKANNTSIKKSITGGGNSVAPQILINTYNPYKEHLEINAKATNVTDYAHITNITEKDSNNFKLYEKKFPKQKLYINIKLNIHIYISEQPDEPIIKFWFKKLQKDNIKLYITLNDNITTYPIDKFTPDKKKNTFEQMNTTDYSIHTQLERKNFNITCVTQENSMYNCKFVSIEVIDFIPPTIEHLRVLWTELDLFYNTTKLENKDNKSNVLMHCTSGTGRSGFMLCSYIWLKTLQEEQTKEKELQEMTQSTNSIKQLTQNVNIPYDYYKLLNIYQSLLDTSVIKFLIKEMMNFDHYTVYELFYLSYTSYTKKTKSINIKQVSLESYDKHEFLRKGVLLFIQRIIIFISAYEQYTNTIL